jgi:nucleoside 2-deoxyribosyltransferase
MKPRVVICGSYHRDMQGLNRLFREIEQTGCRILSPLSLSFDTSDAVVRSKHETDFSAAELEKYHLRAISESDIVWLHLPDGYVGVSCSFEIGYALALGKPIFCFNIPTETMLINYITIVDSVFESLETTYRSSY